MTPRPAPQSIVPPDTVATLLPSLQGRSFYTWHSPDDVSNGQIRGSPPVWFYGRRWAEALSGAAGIERNGGGGMWHLSLTSAATLSQREMTRRTNINLRVIPLISELRVDAINAEPLVVFWQTEGD